MQRKRRHQNGSLTKCKTGEGIVWEIRFVDRSTPIPTRPRFRIGTLAEFPTRAAASRAAQPLRETFNATPTLLHGHRRTFGELIDRYLAEELPTNHSTARGYNKILRVHIRPRWGTVPLAQVRPMDVRAWLRSLPLSSRYRGHIHGMLRRLFRFAMLWEWVPASTNPMSLFSLEGSTKRESQPAILSVAEFQQILAQAPDAFCRTLLLTVMCLGLRISEILALEWRAFDFAAGLVHIRHAAVEGHVDQVKTVASAAPMPLDPLLIQAFVQWRAVTNFASDEDLVFPNSTGGYHSSSNLQRKYLNPIRQAIHLPIPLGWHTFRHSFKSWMDQANVQLTVQRDLMRHADIRTTAQVYGQVRVEELREAGTGVAHRVFNPQKTQI